MKLRVERDVLADAVAWAARTLPARPPLPVLAGLLMTAEGSTLRLSGFDYEVSARIEVRAEVAEEGTVLVSGRLLADICRALPAEPVELTTTDAKVSLVCGRARFALLTLPVEDYPPLPEMPTAAGSIPGDLLAHVAAQVAVAAGRDDTLPALTGVRIEIEGERVTLAATDRYRLAVRELTWAPEQSALSAVALVPGRSLLDTARALSAADKVTVALSPSGSGEALIGFEGNGRRTTQRLLDGEFPKYRSLLPDGSSSVAIVATVPLVEALRRVSLVAERNTPVRLQLSDGMVRLDAGTGEEAQASETVEATLSGEEMTIAFNPGYLLDGLAAQDTAFVYLSFTGPTRPAVLSGTNGPDEPSDDSYRYLLMPVRVAG